MKTPVTVPVDLIASLLKARRPVPSAEPVVWADWAGIVKHFGVVFARQVPRFDEPAFLRACGHSAESPPIQTIGEILGENMSATDVQNPFTPATEHMLTPGNQIESFVAALNAAPQHKGYLYEISPGGKKYIRIIQRYDNGEGGSAYCFIDSSNLDILKTSSWKTPAKGARGNLATVDISKTDPFGSWLYR